MAFVDALNQRGEVQAVPEHWLADFPDQFKPADSEPATTEKPTTTAKAETKKES